MSSPKSPLRRLFGALWAVVVGVYRALILLSLLISLVFIWMMLRGGPPKSVDENVALVIYPTGELVDTADEDPGQRFFQELAGDLPSQSLLRDMVDALEMAADDPRIPLAVLKLDALGAAGLPQLQELAEAVKTFRASGKPVYAYGPFYDQGHYLVAAQASHVSLDPLGMVFFEGLGVYQNYFREALDKLGVEVHVFRVGEYKSAVEPFERNDMSAEAREANQEWLTDLWHSYGRAVAQARHLPDTVADDYVGRLPGALQKAAGDGAAVARDEKLVDAVETLTQFRERIAKTVGWDDTHGSFRQMHYNEYLDARDQENHEAPGADKIVALVVLQGEIVDGDSEPGLAGAETIADQLNAARQDDDVAAVVLRVDSPGGSVFGSERIRRELQNLQAESKPVVVSMSNVAASGGYWVAMDADEIWAHDTTVTGSIGIFALFPTFEKPLEKLGIHTDGLGTTPLAGAFRIDRALSPEASIVIQTQIEQGYNLFVQGVATGRDLPLEKVKDLARGRVWSGADALALGLVDQIGGLNDAIASAARLAGLEPDAYRLEEFKPRYEFPLRRVLDLLNQGGARGLLRGWVPAAAQPLEQVARNLRWLRDPRGLYTHCFCTPSVDSRLR